MPFEKDYRETKLDDIRDLLESARSYNANTTASDAAWVERLVRENETAMHEPYSVTLVLGDKEANMVAERQGDSWRVSGVFDLMESHFGDPEADLVRQVGHYLRTAPAYADDFVKAYLHLRPAREGFAERQLLYMLHDSLVIWRYFQRTEGRWPENPDLSLEAWASPFIEYWQGFRDGLG